MKFFENKNIFQKMIIAILIVTMFTFIFSCNVQAKDDIGGKLLKPVVSLLTSMGDGLMDVAHNAILQQDGAYIRIDLSTSAWNVILMIGAIVLGAIIVGAAVYFTGGVALPAIIAKLGGTTVAAISAGTIVVAGISGAIIGGAVFHSNVMGDDLVLPLYSVTPEEIFSGELAIFDVDFFNPNTTEKKANKSIKDNTPLKDDEMGILAGSSTSDVINNLKNKYKMNENDINLDFGTVLNNTKKTITLSNGIKVTCKSTVETGSPGNYILLYYINDKNLSNAGDSSNSKESSKEYVSIAMQLRTAIASWYRTLRNIAIVGSLSILIYIAIRIIMSSTTADKAKYKQRLYDWLISLCLIFIMHYIMAGSNIFVKKLSGLLNSVQKPKYIAAMVLDDNGDKNKVKDALTENIDALVNYNIIKDEDSLDDLFTEQDGKDAFIWPTNLMGLIRIETQRVKQESTVAYAGYTIMFVVLVIFTVSFTATYLKRILYLAFLTIIAPFVAMTYALDKLKDGSAQGFNNWFKEYIVNLLIQPIHLLLYTVLVSSAIQIAESNLLYGIVAIGFMMPAEKLVRKFFGINATETQGLLAGPAGAALVMSGVNRFLGHRPPPLHNSGAQNEKDIKDKINYKDSLDTDVIYAGANSASITENSTDNSTVNTLPPNDTSSMPSTGIGDIKNIPKTFNTSDENNNYQDIQGEDIDTDAVPQAMAEDAGDGNYTSSEINGNNNAQNRERINQTQSKINSKTPTTPKNNSKHNNKLLRLGNGIRRGIKFYGRGLGKNMANAINKGDPARKMINFAHGLGTAALAGGVGIAAGVASGDLTKTGQYAAAAALGGHKLGSSLSEWGTGALNVPNAGEYFARGYYGDQEYEEKEREKIIKRMKKERMNDEFIRDFSLRTDMTEKDAKEYLEKDDFLEEGLKYGFSDANEFAAAKKAKEIVSDQTEAFRYTKIVKNQGTDINTYEYDRKKKDAFIQSIGDKYRSKNPNSSKNNEEVNNAVDKYYNRLLQISDVYYKD